MIYVTKPFLPPKDEYLIYIDGIWQRNWLTNNGPLVNELELKLKRYLKLNHLLFLTNGTIAIQIAIKALDLKGEIITTPFSYVATTSSVVWEGCKPIFVDIDKDSFNIDPSKIEAAITKKTSGILATHVFGNPCDVEAIDQIAKKHNLKVIYDAAHAFGVNIGGESVFTYGDISTTSFHATKLFHTIEGGAVITKNQELLKRMAHMRNFGHESPTTFQGIGINGKNSEFHAAMGLTNLKYIEEIKERRKVLCQFYKEKLTGIDIDYQKLMEGQTYNYAYFPVLFENEAIMLKVKQGLERSNIFTRRYFYPSLSSLKYVEKQSTPVSDDIANRVLCLPLYHLLSFAEIEMIIRLIKRILKY